MVISPGPNEDALLVDINTTPLVDVMLVLLIMLIVTIPLHTDATRMELSPTISAPPATGVIAVTIDATGVIAWDGVPVADAAALEARMRQAAGGQPVPELRLRPDRNTAYRRVMAVLSAAQRAGLTRIGFVGQEQFAD